MNIINYTWDRRRRSNRRGYGEDVIISPSGWDDTFVSNSIP